MIQETFQKIEERVRSADNLSQLQKQEWLGLLADLRREANVLAGMDADQAQSIVGFTDLSTHEVTRSVPRPELTRTALQGLTESVNGFEAAHPRLTDLVNRLATAMSNLGI